MSATGRAVEVLLDWRAGHGMAHTRHGWGADTCLRCEADRDPYDVLCQAAEIMGWVNWDAVESNRTIDAVSEGS